MDILSEDFCAWLGDARRDMERDLERRKEALEDQQRVVWALQKVEEIANENESLREQLAEEKRARAELEMKMAELSKLSAGVAKKSSEEDLLKALRTYANRSKRKTADKRMFAKSAILEIAIANGLDLPEDLKAVIESLDDEQTEPKIVIENAADVIAEGGVKNVRNT